MNGQVPEGGPRPAVPPWRAKDPAAALEALRVTWDAGYEIGYDVGVWWARRLDNGDLLTASIPDELGTKITADYAFRPVRLEAS